MKVLIVGGGGREHALTWKTARSERVEHIYVAPGNAGTALEPKTSNVDISATDIDGLLQFAVDQAIDLTIVGPEAPLVEGIVDQFTDAGLRCFGPSAKAAQLEGSKAFTKDFLARHSIPTAVYETFTDIEQAEAYIRMIGAPIVIKADGLAAGKGVTIAQTEEEAIAVAREMLSGNAFGEAGHCIVVEEFLKGEEASFIVMVDGHNIVPMATSQDHKARDNGDKGPNTGGMGAYSPAPVVTSKVYDEIMKTIIEPTVKGMAEEGNTFRGFLYAGVMINEAGTPYVLEFNTRMGDPETQPIMMRLKSDLVDLCLASIGGRLDQVDTEWDERPALGVVMASGGYPETYDKGHIISGIENVNIPDAKVFHAGTSLSADGDPVTSGGRVLCVCALGDSVSEAQQKAYNEVKKINWQDVYYRTDIGYRAAARES